MMIDKLEKNTGLIRILIADEISSLLDEGVNPVEKPLYIAKNVSIIYAEINNIDFESIFPLIMMIVEMMLERAEIK